MYNNNGELIGVVLQGVRGWGQNVFAVPINLARNLLDMTSVNLQPAEVRRIANDFRNLPEGKLNQRISDLEAAIDSLRKEISWEAELIKTPSGHVNLQIRYSRVLEGELPASLQVAWTPWGKERGTPHDKRLLTVPVRLNITDAPAVSGKSGAYVRLRIDEQIDPGIQDLADDAGVLLKVMKERIVINGISLTITPRKADSRVMGRRVTFERIAYPNM